MLTETELAWLAGFLEGEGSFIHGAPSYPTRPRIEFQTTDADVADRAGSLLGSNVWKGSPPKKAHWKQVYIAAISGAKAVAMMEKLFPLMGSRRQEQIRLAIACFENRSLHIPEETKKLILKALANATQKEVAILFGIRRETVNRIANSRTRSSRRP